MQHRQGPWAWLQHPVLIATLLLCPHAGQAQPASKIWRCGNAYSDRPCSAGKEIAPAQALPPRAQMEADAATQKIAREAEAMARERERQEARAAGRGPGVIAHPSPWEAKDKEREESKAGSNPKRPKTSKGRSPKAEHFTARGESKR